MRKRINILFYSGIILLLLTGCNNESSIAPPLGEEAVEVRLSASVSSIEATVTRSIITGTELAERSEVGVFGLTEKEGSFSNPYISNQKYLCAGTSGQLLIQPNDTVINYPPGQDKLYLFGYYPYTTHSTTDEYGNAFIPVTGTKDGEDVTDYLYTGCVTGSKSLAAAGNYQVSLPLKHALAILRLKIYTDTEEYTDGSHPTLNSISFIPREAQEGRMDLRTGIITSDNSDNRTSVTLDYTTEKPGIIAGNAPVQKDYLLLPYENEENSAIRKLVLNVSMPDEAQPKDIVVFDEADSDADRNDVIVKLKAGYITTINIKYTQSMAAKASVNEWQNGEEHTFE